MCLSLGIDYGLNNYESEKIYFTLTVNISFNEKKEPNNLDSTGPHFTEAIKSWFWYLDLCMVFKKTFL